MSEHDDIEERLASSGFNIDQQIAYRVIGEDNLPTAVDEDGCMYRRLPPYSSDVAAAHQVIARMGELGWWCVIKSPFDPANGAVYWVAGFTPHSTSGWNGKPDFSSVDESMPRAVCKAALAALEGAK